MCYWFQVWLVVAVVVRGEELPSAQGVKTTAKRGAVGLGYGYGLGGASDYSLPLSSGLLGHHGALELGSLGYAAAAPVKATISTVNHAVAIPVPQPYPVTVTKQVAVPVPHPVPVSVPRPRTGSSSSAVYCNCSETLPGISSSTCSSKSSPALPGVSPSTVSRVCTSALPCNYQ